MNETPMPDPAPVSELVAETPPRKSRIRWNLAGLIVSVLAIVAVLALWTTTRQFADMVRSRLAARIQAATGGRVEIGSFAWRPLHLEAQAGHVVIHGDELPSEAPYAQIESLRVQISILGILSPTVRLDDLEIVRPHIHLIFYADGATNQPRPAQRHNSSESGIDTLFKLKAGRVAVQQGIIHLDHRATSLDFQDRYQPLDFKANDLDVLMQYVAAVAQSPEHYHAQIAIKNLDLTRGGMLLGKVPPVHGIMQASVDLERDALELRSLQISSRTEGTAERVLSVTGSLVHFAQPEWQARVNGELDLRLLDPILGYNFAPDGLAHIDVIAGGSGSAFHADGTVHAEHASYIGTGVMARGIDLTTRVHADQDWLRVTGITARLAEGGAMGGEVLLHHWLPPEPAHEVIAAPPAPVHHRFSLHRQAAPPPTAPAAHQMLVKKIGVTIPVDGTVNANFQNMTVDTILSMVSLPPFQKLGFSALVNGPVQATWVKGDVNTLSVAGRLNLTPPSQPAAGEVPTSGIIDATYTQRDGSVAIRTFSLSMPASRFEANGRLGAYPLTSPTNLKVDFQTHNLGEFDAVFRALGLERQGKAGTQALPVALGGEADFHGSWAGSLVSPRLDGNVNARDVSLEFPPGLGATTGQPRTIHWDSIQASGTYGAEHIAIVHADLHRGLARIQLEGTLTAAGPAVVTKSGKHSSPDGTPAFDANSVLHARIQAEKVAMADLLPLTGADLPVDGLLNAQFTAEGSLKQIRGAGWAELNQATIAGESVRALHAQGSLANQVVHISALTANLPSGTVAGSGTYDFAANRFQFEATSNGLDLAQIQHVKTSAPSLGGRAEFAVTAAGTRATPEIGGHATFRDISLQGQSLGTVEMTAHTAGRALIYAATSQNQVTQINAQGEIELTEPYNTRSHLQFSQIDVGELFRMSRLTSISGKSAIAGSANVEGPLARPAELHGDVRLDPVQAVVAGVNLRSDGPIHATLAQSRIDLDPVHVTGDDTDLRAKGSLALKGDQRLDFAASGSVNLKLLETVDPDVTAQGGSTFAVEAHGTLSDPGLTGRVDFQNGSLALEGLPNGLSQLHGTLVFNQNRLEVKSLTAMTGGGQLSLGGYLAYQHGLYADLTVSGRSVRIRYPAGVSSLADADLRLQGTQSSLLLSGKVLLTRFSVSPDLDIAALAAQNTSQTIVPPDAPSNHVRLDVRIQSSPQLNFQNAYAKLAGDIDLRLRGTLAAPSLLGRVSITEGDATIAGTRYELQRGEITFTNPVRIQPNIDLNATARVEDYDITLGIHGTTDKPLSVTYRSDPPLPEADVVALLALGRTQSETGLYTQQQQQSAGLSPNTDVLLGGALNATVSSRVQKLFGAGSVKVDPNYLGALGNSTTRITVEEQLGRYVTLIYATNVNTSAQQLLQAELAINRHVSVQVTRDESGVFSMVIKAIRRYR